MSLKGSLETVALPEVLHLLADTSKSGELRVQGSRLGGRLWFDEGALAGFEVGRSTEAADAIFELLREQDGDFSFEADAKAPESAQVPDKGSQVVGPVLEVAQERLAEWAEIVAVVPSLGHQVHLVDEAPRDEVVLDRGQWSLLVAIGEGHTVQQVLDARDLREFDGCKALKPLVDSELVVIHEPAVSEAAVVEEPVVEEPVLEDPAVEEPAVEEPVSHELAAEELTFEAPAPSYEPFGYEVAGEQPAEEPVAEVHDESAVTEEVDEDVPHYQAPAAMEALLAELGGSEAPVSDGETHHEEAPVDGLSDRGPWTANELDQMGEWDQPVAVDAEPAPVAAFHPGSTYDEVGEDPAYDDSAYDTGGYDNAAYAADEHAAYSGDEHTAYGAADYAAGDETTDETGDESEPEQPAEEPINRGLLLKFLSSVRN